MEFQETEAETVMRQVMRKLYAAYCRSAAQCGCNPVAIGGAILVIGLAVLGYAIVGWVGSNAQAIEHGFAIAGAVALTFAAAGLLTWAARITAKAEGNHADPATIPVRPVPLRVPPPAAPESVPVPQRPGQPAFTYRLRKPGDEAKAMRADADALAKGRVTPGVAPDGTLTETGARKS